MRSMERHFSKLHILSTNKFIRSNFLFAFSVRAMLKRMEKRIFFGNAIAHLLASKQASRQPGCMNKL